MGRDRQELDVLKVLVRRQYVEVVPVYKDLVVGHLALEHVKNRFLDLLRVVAQVVGRLRLVVQVDNQHFHTLDLKGRCYVNRAGGFADAPLVV